MSPQDIKVQGAINLIEPLVQAAQQFLSQSTDKEDKDKAVEVIAAWRLIINQCGLASEARNMANAIQNIIENDATN